MVNPGPLPIPNLGRHWLGLLASPAPTQKKTAFQKRGAAVQCGASASRGCRGPGEPAGALGPDAMPVRQSGLTGAGQSEWSGLRVKENCIAESTSTTQKPPLSASICSNDLGRQNEQNVPGFKQEEKANGEDCVVPPRKGAFRGIRNRRFGKKAKE